MTVFTNNYMSKINAVLSKVILKDVILRDAKIILGLAILFTTFLPNTSWALASDRNQPIKITADNQHVDMKSNKVTFSGNVVLTQGSIRLTASEVIVSRNSKTNKLESMESRGYPARFQQKTDDGKLMKGQANNLHYFMNQDKIILTTNAQLHQDDSVITGEKITYLIAEEVLEAQSGSGGRVTTTILPSQLEN